MNYAAEEWFGPVPVQWKNLKRCLTGNLERFLFSEDVLMLEELQQRVDAIEEKLLQIRGYL